MKTIDNSEHDQPITLCDWNDVGARLSLVDRPENTVYGVPSGGMIAAGFLAAAKNVHDPTEASIILVDVIRSDEQREAIERQFPDKGIRVLFDQTATDRNRGWLVMPWEEQEPAKPTERGRSGLADAEWSLWQSLTGAIEQAMGMPWLDPASAEAFRLHATAARATIEARPTERALLDGRL
jgi:hypothetical protein